MISFPMANLISLTIEPEKKKKTSAFGYRSSRLIGINKPLPTPFEAIKLTLSFES